MYQDTYHVYDVDRVYKGLKKDCDEYKILRIIYLEKYRNAIIKDNVWLERHYLRKLLVCIRYANFSEGIENRLKKIFSQRSYAIALTLSRDDLPLTYYYTINDGQKYPYERFLIPDLRNLYNIYKKSGFTTAGVEVLYDKTKYNGSFNESSMEKEMRQTLENYGYEVTVQKEFPRLLSPSGHPLRFDGCIVKNGQTILIECQGEQHYRSIPYFGGDEGLIKTQTHDLLKKQYCIKKRIPLLLIKYNKSVTGAIEDFLDKESYEEIVYEYK